MDVWLQTVVQCLCIALLIHAMVLNIVMLRRLTRAGSPFDYEYHLTDHRYVCGLFVGFLFAGNLLLSITSMLDIGMGIVVFGLDNSWMLCRFVYFAGSATEAIFAVTVSAFVHYRGCFRRRCGMADYFTPQTVKLGIGMTCMVSCAISSNYNFMFVDCQTIAMEYVHIYRFALHLRYMVDYLLPCCATLGNFVCCVTAKRSVAPQISMPLDDMAVATGFDPRPRRSPRSAYRLEFCGFNYSFDDASGIVCVSSALTLLVLDGPRQIGTMVSLFAGVNVDVPLLHNLSYLRLLIFALLGFLVFDKSSTLDESQESDLLANELTRTTL